MKNPFSKVRIFYQETVGELKKSSWPTKVELRDSSIVVIIGMILIGLYISTVDASLYQVVSLFTGWVTG